MTGSAEEPRRNMFAGSSKSIGSIRQWFSISGPQEFLNHAIPDSLVRGTHLSSHRFSDQEMITANTTIAVWCE